MKNVRITCILISFVFETFIMTMVIINVNEISNLNLPNVSFPHPEAKQRCPSKLMLGGGRHTVSTFGANLTSSSKKSRAMSLYKAPA